MGGQPGSNQLLGKVSQPWACAPHRHERKRPLRHGLAYKAHGAHFVWHRGVKGARAPMVVSEVTLLLGPFLCLAAMARNQMRGPSSLAGEVQGTVRLTGPGHQATTLLPKWPEATLLCRVLEFGLRSASEALVVQGGKHIGYQPANVGVLFQKEKKDDILGFIPEHQLASLEVAIHARKKKMGR